MRKLSANNFMALLALSVVGLMVACSPKEEPVGPDNGNNNQNNGTKVEVSGVALNKATASLAVSESVDLTATVSPSNASDKNVSWSTSDASVATVSNGKVTAKKEGTVTITATAGGKSATCTITVTKGGFPEGKLPADNEIWYITSDHKPLTRTSPLQSIGLQSNTYSGGMGVLKFSGPVTASTILSEDPDECKKITGILVPDCLETIGEWSFYYEYGIKEFRIPASLKMVKGGFGGSVSLEKFTGNHLSKDGRCVVIDKVMYGFAPAGVSSYEIPSGIVRIATAAFANAQGLKSLVIPSGVEALEEFCFNSAGFESVTIPASVKTIHPYAFMGCNNLRNLLGDSPFISADRKFLYQKDDRYDPMSLFFFTGKDDTSYEIPEGIQGIQYYAFDGCKKLKSVTLPKSLNSIKGADSFRGCDNLEALYGYHTTSDHKGFVSDSHQLQFVIPNIDPDYVVPDDVTSLGGHLFEGMQNLRSVTMGDQVTTFGDYVFTSCRSLKTVTLSANLASVGLNPFWYCEGLEAVYFRSLIPPAYGDQQYSEIPALKVYVPSQAYRIYTSDAGWAKFRSAMVPYDYNDLPKPDFYISSDYSKEGEVTVYQKAKEGNGIDVVFMGDAYSDREVANGKYLKDMKNCAESFFNVEPYKSFRNLFNIYFVTTVSATEGYERGGRSLGTVRGDGTFMSGNDEKCLDLALKAVKDEARMDDVLVIVCGNQDLTGTIYVNGVCDFYEPSVWDGHDYACGPAVTYFLKLDDSFAETADLVHHESGGHGFAKLADEYVTDGTVQSRDIERLRNFAPYMWYSNVDITSDPSQIKWSKFLSDERYKKEGIGIFEGGYTYQYGVWRPTENSIMNDNRGSFNAPSRYTIWYRIHKLAYGKSWNGTFDDFVAYDAVNRKSSNASGTKTRAGMAVLRDRRLSPPVMTHRTWREAKGAE